MTRPEVKQYFPINSIFKNGFSVPKRLDQNSKGSGILLYVRDRKWLFYHWRDIFYFLFLYFLFINITFLFNSITFFVYRHDSWKCFYGKCWDHFNPPKSEEEIPGSWVTCICASKIPHIFKKQKKLHRNYLRKTFNSE